MADFVGLERLGYTSGMLPRKFQKALKIIKKLENYDRYAGAFVFGSVAKGSVSGDSDLDVKVIVNKDNACQHINHPFLEGIKLDITFLSFRQLQQEVQQAKTSTRPAFLAGAKILFDKTGNLRKLQRKVSKRKPMKFTQSHFPHQQFILYHIQNKVERNVKNDPHTALLAMHIGLQEILKIHYGLRGHWRVSDKKMLQDLERWDRPFAVLLKKFLDAKTVTIKFRWWTRMIEAIAKAMGGKMDIHDMLCDCSVSRKDLQNLYEVHGLQK